MDIFFLVLLADDPACKIRVTHREQEVEEEQQVLDGAVAAAQARHNVRHVESSSADSGEELGWAWLGGLAGPSGCGAASPADKGHLLVCAGAESNRVISS